MSFGFNSDVRLGEQLCHVQTEEHGPTHPVIETVVYVEGRVLHRRSSSYRDLAGVSKFDEHALRRRVEEQHRAVIEELRSGRLPIPARRSDLAASAAEGIQVRLLNPDSWLETGSISLDVQVVTRSDGRPLEGAKLEVRLEGPGIPLHLFETTDQRGRARLQFLLPAQAASGAVLVIHARGESGEDEIRYTVPSKAKPPAA